MAAQDYYQSFQQPTRPMPVPFQGNPSPQQSPYGSSPRISSPNAGALAPYSTSPYPTAPGAGPQRQSPPYPTSDYPPQPSQFLAPPGGPPPQNFGSPGYFPPQQQQNGYPGPPPSNPYGYPPNAPLTLQRSASEPPDNRRLSLASAGSYGDRPHHHRKDYDSDDDEDDSDRERSRSRGSRDRKGKHRDRSGTNTFLGAGGGAIVGDAIFPGLGTLGGALLGGLGGHEYSRRRSKSDMDGKKHHHHKEKYANGVTVRSEWGLIER